MTKKELVQLYYLNREILNDTEELIKLKMRNQASNDEDGEAEKEFIACREREIVKKIQRCTEVRDKVKEFIESIDDSLTRQVFYYRYSKCMHWQQVAYMIGGGNTAESVRKISERYLKKIGGN